MRSLPPAPRRPRRLFVAAAVVVVSGLVVITAGPAVAESSGAMAASAAAPTDRSRTPNDLERQAVERQQRAVEARIAHQVATQRVEVLEAQHDRLVRQADQTAAEASRRYDELAEQSGSLASSLSAMVTGDDSPADAAEAAAATARHAGEVAALAARALDEARTEAAGAEDTWNAAEAAAKATEAAVSARAAAETAAQQAEFRRGYQAGDKAQDRRNRKALRAWRSYLMSLADAGVVPPAASDLARPRRLPRNLEPVRDAKGRLVRGVASVDPEGSTPVVVLPAETIRAVSAAFRRVGLPRNTETDPDTYACGGLAQEAWADAAMPIPADSSTQWESLHAVRDGQRQVGDLVFLGDDDRGVQRTGVHLGGRMMITADPEDGEVVVMRAPAGQPYGARRVPLSSTEDGAAPATSGVSTGCGFAADAPAPGGTALWTHPLGEASYTTSASFGVIGALWSSGRHSGQDFAAPTGTPVYAARPGVVTVERPGWAGNLVRIDHGGGVETWYAHLSLVAVESGQQVAAGDVVGAVGSTGNSTGPHLHFEARLDGDAIDPMMLLGPVDSSPTWGDFANGEIPESAMCAATPGGQLLRCDAAAAYRLLAAAFAAEMGTTLCITDSYRSREGQEHLFVSKPNLAAVPGTSVHGLGLAVDLCGGVERFGTPEHLWMLANGPALGWHHPAWAGANGSRPEPWHFEFDPAG